MGKQKLQLAGGFKLIQYDNHMKLGTDSVLLADFARLRRRDYICDLGCGIGSLTVLLSTKRDDITIDAVDIQPDVVKICAKNVSINRLQSRVNVIETDYVKQSRLLRTGNYSVVVCNPPYIPVGTGKDSGTKGRMFARTESMATIEDICYTVRRLLQNGGAFYVVYRPDRLVDLFMAMHNMDIEPKRVRFVCGRTDKPPSLVLVEGKRHAHTGLMTLPNLYMYDDQGLPTEEFLKIYGREDLFRAVREPEEKLELERELENQAIEEELRNEQLAEERMADEARFDEEEAGRQHKLDTMSSAFMDGDESSVRSDFDSARRWNPSEGPPQDPDDDEDDDDEDEED